MSRAANTVNTGKPAEAVDPKTSASASAVANFLMLNGMMGAITKGGPEADSNLSEIWAAKPRKKNAPATLKDVVRYVKIRRGLRKKT